MSYQTEAPPLLREFLAYHDTIKGQSEKTVDSYFMDLRTFTRYLYIARDLVPRDTALEDVDIHGADLDFYGAVTLAQINQDLEQRARDAGHHLLHLQSNAEYELIERIHAARSEGVDFILINPAAFTHTSVALRDALLAVSIPFIEVHLSNVHKREPFRHHSYFSDVAVGVICGLGASGYRLALEAALEQLAAS